MSNELCGKLIVPGMEEDAREAQPGDGEFERRLKGAKLLTAEVLYYMPDHPSLLQTYLWQTLDEALKNGDRTTAGAMAHKIAGVSGQYGCVALRRAARALEKDLEEKGADTGGQAGELAGMLTPALEFLKRCAAAARG